MATCLICGLVPTIKSISENKDVVCSKCVLWLVEHPRSQGERFEDVVTKLRGGQIKTNENKEEIDKETEEKGDEKQSIQQGESSELSSPSDKGRKTGKRSRKTKRK